MNRSVFNVQDGPKKADTWETVWVSAFFDHPVFLNNARYVGEWTASGKLFQTEVAAAEKPLMLMVARQVREITKAMEDEERSHWRVWTSETHCSCVDRYLGAELWRQREVSTANRNIIQSATHNQWRLQQLVGWCGCNNGLQIPAVLQHSGHTGACRPADVANQKAQCCCSQDITALKLPRVTVALAEWRTMEYGTSNATKNRRAAGSHSVTTCITAIIMFNSNRQPSL